MPMFIITGSRIRHAISSPRSSSSARQHLEVVERHDVRVLGHHRRGCRSTSAWSPAPRGRPSRSEFGHDREHHRVVVAVVRALDLDDVLAPGGRTGDADRAHRRLGARVAEAHRLRAGSARHSSSAKRTVGLGGRGEVRAGARGALDGLGDLRVGVADDHRSRSRCGSRGTRCRRRPRRRLPFPSREVDRVRVPRLERRRHAHAACAAARARTAPSSPVVRAPEPVVLGFARSRRLVRSGLVDRGVTSGRGSLDRRRWRVSA